MSETIPNSTKKLLQWVVEVNNTAMPAAEKQSIAYMVLEHLFKIDKVEIITDRSVNLSKSQWKSLRAIADRINQEEPIQYILEEADFYGRKFTVSRSVLIPRNETEELAALIVHDHKGKKIRLLDIGTGTGCIAITVAKELKLGKVHAIDFDPRVIKVARVNATLHQVDLDIMMIDVLKENIPLQGLDVIVSNPPYVLDSEKEVMSNNVLQYEPQTALFVSDDQPIIFYEIIADRALEALRDEGKLYFEINERFGEQVKFMLERKGFKHVTVIQDIHGKDRIVRGSKSFA